APWNTQLRLAHALHEPSFELVLAALFHDLPGLPPSQVEAFCRRLRLSNRSTEQVVWLAAHQQALRDALRLPLSKLKRILIEEFAGDLLALMRAEIVAKGT